MANISVTFDTKTKKMAASIDEVTVANVMGVRLGLAGREDDGEKYYCELMTASKDKDNGMTTYTHVMAAEMAPKDIETQPVDGLEGFVGYVDAATTRDDAAFMRTVAEYFA